MYNILKTGKNLNEYLAINIKGVELEKCLKNGEYATLLEQKIRAKKEKMEELDTI